VPATWGVFGRTMVALLGLPGLGSFHASALEIYMDVAYDLLDGRKILKVGNGAKAPPEAVVSKFGVAIEHAHSSKPGGLHPSSCYCRQCFAAQSRAGGVGVAKAKAARERGEAAAKAAKSVSRHGSRERLDTGNTPGRGRKAKPADGEFETVGETMRKLESAADVAKLARLIEGERCAASHELNERSSRSHCLLRVVLTLMNAGRVSKRQFLFVDLAGSERINKSKVSGTRQQEALNINTSLSALARVIKMLGQSSGKPGGGHVPFRDSTLTKLLRSSFAGKSCTNVVVNVSGDPAHADETVASLRFGARLATVRTSAVVEQSKDAAQEYAEAEMAILAVKAELAAMTERGLGGGFGDDVPQSERTTFWENRQKHGKVAKEYAKLKAQMAEASTNPEKRAAIAAKATWAKSQMDNLHDILFRQKTIYGFWNEPHVSYTRAEAQLESLEARVAMLQGGGGV
jgi:hypothetical protein